ncbi:MAG: hypothetical protein EOO15_11295 [Chitinophagaceae bacterium]|nr:MAG: hypothetical protein EOO15_11295 [Chitinophagaceae bacterium]
MNRLLLLICLFLMLSAGAQTHRLRSLRDGSPIPWASIKILNRPQGAISNQVGFFELTLQPGDTALISSIGYAPLQLTTLPEIIELEPLGRSMDTVLVRQSIPIRKVMLGNGLPFLNEKLSCEPPWDSPAGRCYPWGVGGDAGKAEFAERIELPDSSKPYRLLRLWLPTRESDCYGNLLIRIYAEDLKTGAPGEELFVKQVVIDKTSVRKNKLKIVVDLSADQLQLLPGRSFFLSTGWPPGTTFHCFSIIPLFSGPQTDTWHRSPARTSYGWVPMTMKGLNDTKHRTVHTLYTVELEERDYR